MTQGSAGNPLLAMEFRIPFDRVRPEHVEPAMDQLLAEARARIVAIEQWEGTRSFENTLEALEYSSEGLDHAAAVVGHLEGVATTPELRAAYAAVQPKLTEFYSSVSLSEPLWKALKAYAATDEAAGLTGARKRYLEKKLESFRREGADLDPEGKRKLAAIDVELGKASLKFSQNVVDATGAFELVIRDQARLAGLPESAMTAARESAAARGVEGWRFTLQAPSYMPVMTYADDAGIRETMYRAYNTRATSGETDNRPILARMLALRQEKARLLGFAHFADLVLDDRMAKRGDAAKKFLENLADKARPFFERENAQLLAFRRTLEGDNAPALQPWDVAYYAEKLRVKLYDFNDEAVRPYFAVDRVLAGIFSIATRLYGVTIVPWSDAPVWDPSVQPFEVRDASGAAIGAFYVDVYPRESKRDGAWMDGLVTGVPGREVTKHLGVLAANVTPPVGGRPGLLTHHEVETLFHEFGHLMHHCLSRGEIRSLSGTHVAWDFVELPSMIMENWSWEREALNLFARHHETGEALDDEILTRMRRARTYRAANAMMRQIGFAAMDLSLHTDYDPSRDGDPVTYSRAFMQAYSTARLPEEHAMVAGFTHLFASPVGYAAGYYSYKWAEVLEADAFTRFKREGIFNARVGAEFREAILASGDGDEPMNLYKRFMGREPDLSALLERSGLVEGAATSP